MKYKCLKCGEYFDVKWDVKCPKCGAKDWDCEPVIGSSIKSVEMPPEASVPVIEG